MPAKKRVLMSLLEDNDGLARKLAEEVRRCGLDVTAHLWDPDPKAMAFGAYARELASCQAWIVVGGDYADKWVRQSLALCALCVQAEQGHAFPILLSPRGPAPELLSLPTPLTGAEVVKSGLGAKAAVRAQTFTAAPADYRLTPHGLGQLGLWFELGPKEGFWDGAFFASGCAKSEEGRPQAHGVGPKGSIPEKCTLNYPVTGLTLVLHDIDCVGYGVKNTLNAASSYFVKVSACPDVLSFGPFPDTDEAELFTLNLA